MGEKTIQVLYFFFYSYGDLRDLHAFPTRRSSDLAATARCPGQRQARAVARERAAHSRASGAGHHQIDRKSTRLNSSHSSISYAVFCLKKKKHKLRTVHDIRVLLQNLVTLMLMIYL